MNPFDELVREVRQFLQRVGEVINRDLTSLPVSKAQPRFGYLAVPLHSVMREVTNIDSILEDVAERFEFKYLQRPRLVSGFLNFDVNPREYSKLVIDAALSLRERYGYSDKCPRGKFLIEHTSANPLHPLHIGHARNAVLGDTLARLLRFCGCEVRTHFYLNDCGDQVSYAVLGFDLVRDVAYRRIREGRKPDHVVGLIYAVTCTVAEIKRLNREIKSLEKVNPERANELRGELDSLVAAVNRLREQDPELVDMLVRALGPVDDLDLEAKRITRLYEQGDLEVVKKVREVVNLVVEGFRQTLTRMSIEFDSWDWESEVAVYSGKAVEVVRQLLRRVPNFVETDEGGAIVFRADKYAELLNLWDELGLPRSLPRAVLLRRDGTTLYLTRDVAYALWCFEKFNPDRIIRVIAAEQRHPQAQLRVILHALGYPDLARRVVHYAYEMVVLPGVKMSGRRGEYVTLDEILDETKRRVRDLIRDRFSSQEELDRVSEAVAVGAVRYALVSVGPLRPMTFDWSKVINLRQNSGPFLQYTYVRAKSILEKAGVISVMHYQVPEELAPEEVDLVKLIGEVPEVVAKAASDLRPDYLAEHANRIALTFNSFYEKYPVVRADEPYRGFRLALVEAVKICLSNIMSILGVPALERM